MSNDKQNSIEWFAKESWKLRVELEDEKISLGEYANKYYQLKQQAKAMYEQECKDLITGTYMDIKMKNHKLPYGFAYFDKLAKVESEAEKYYKKVCEVIHSDSTSI